MGEARARTRRDRVMAFGYFSGGGGEKGDKTPPSHGCHVLTLSGFVDRRGGFLAVVGDALLEDGAKLASGDVARGGGRRVGAAHVRAPVAIIRFIIVAKQKTAMCEAQGASGRFKTTVVSRMRGRGSCPPEKRRRAPAHHRAARMLKYLTQRANCKTDPALVHKYDYVQVVLV